MVISISVRRAMHMHLTRFVARVAMVRAVLRDDMPRHCQRVGSHEQGG